MPNLLVSTVGTSLLTNYVLGRRDSGLQIVLRDTANAQERELTKQQQSAIDGIAEEVAERLVRASPEEIRRMSAELNGVFAYYGQEAFSALPAGDYHVLIATDTYQGQKTAFLVRDCLKRLGAGAVEIIAPAGLSTRECLGFTKGINELIKWCEEVLTVYRQQKYHIVFNLVGSFKSLQGYMNTLGMFYADEMIYIFEAPSADLIRIPRLPVTMSDVSVLRKKAALFVLMEHGYLASREEVKDIPEIYLDFDEGGACTLSTWGLLVWERNKKEILGGAELLPFPNLHYEKSFERDFARIGDKDLKAAIQSELGKVSLIYKERGLGGLRADTGFLYKDYKGLKEEGIGHFRLSQGWRVSCRPEGDLLRLRHVGDHDYVTSNP